MKKALACVVVAGCACAAQADLLQLPDGAPVYNASNSLITSLPLGASDPTDGVPVYSSIPGPYSAFAAGQFASRDDYVSNQGGSTFNMDALRFAGGVTTAGMQLDFFLLDSATNVVSSFGVTLPQGGDFIWTITVGSLPAATAGFLQIQTHSATDSGRWFLTTTAAAPGSNSFSTGFGSTLTPPQIATFELQTPAPGVLALMGLGGLVATRRRR